MRGRGRGRGRGRRVVRMLEPALLLLLHHGPAHGYTLLEQLGEFGLSQVDPSAIYRMLRDMEEKKWVASVWDEEQSQGPPRRVYQITALGDEVLSLWAQDLEESRKRIGHLLGVYRRHMEEGEGEYH
jgi:poly-beta-hydroxybutyrate-responsive repressor